MPWSNKQKALLVRACKAAGLADQRDLILRQLGGRAEHPAHSGRVTSTSPRLTDRDFEQAMATVEHYSGGQIRVIDAKGRHLYGPGHWDRHAETGTLTRRRHLIRRMVNTLVGNPRTDGDGRILDEDGHQLAGVIRQATGGKASTIDQLTERQASAVIDALTALGHRHGVTWNNDPRRADAHA